MNPRTQGPGKHAAGIVAANALGATMYVTLAILALERAKRGGNGVTPEPLLSTRAHWLLVLFVLTNLVWGSLMFARPRWRRWDLYAFVWIGWLVAIWLGSGLASI